MVGAVGFEPTTSCSQGRHANQAALRPDDVMNVMKYQKDDFHHTKLLYFVQALYKLFLFFSFAGIFLLDQRNQFML